MVKTNFTPKEARELCEIVINKRDVDDYFWQSGMFFASGKRCGDIDMRQLSMGIDVEAEHFPEPLKRTRIALDHLAEFQKYYDALAKMEKQLAGD